MGPGRPDREGQCQAHAQDRYADDDHRAGQNRQRSTPPSEVRIASTGKPQATIPRIVTNLEASLPNTISASERS